MLRHKKAATTEPKASKEKAAEPVVDVNAIAGQQGDMPSDGGDKVPAIETGAVVTGGDENSGDDAGSEMPAKEEAEEPNSEPAVAENHGNGKDKKADGYDFPAEFVIDNQTRTRIVVAGVIVQPYSKETVIIRSERDLKRCEVNCEQLAHLNKGKITVQMA